MPKPRRIRTPDDDPNLESARADAENIRADLDAALAAAEDARRRRRSLIVLLRDSGYTYAETKLALGVHSPDIARALAAADKITGTELAGRILDIATSTAEAWEVLAATPAPDGVRSAAEAELGRRAGPDPSAPPAAQTSAALGPEDWTDWAHGEDDHDEEPY